jgi:hypothetical protein
VRSHRASGASIKVSDPVDGAVERTITLAGTPQQLAAAEGMLQTHLASGTGPGAAGFGGGFGGGGTVVEVPGDEVAARIIGRGGQVSRQLGPPARCSWLLRCDASPQSINEIRQISGATVKMSDPV